MTGLQSKLSKEVTALNEALQDTANLLEDAWRERTSLEERLMAEWLAHHEEPMSPGLCDKAHLLRSKKVTP